MSYGETRHQAADRLLAGLHLDVDHADPPEVAERKAKERAARLDQHDHMFRDGFTYAGGRLMSNELATKLGYRIDRPAFTAASEPDDGEIGDEPRA